MTVSGFIITSVDRHLLEHLDSQASQAPMRNKLSWKANRFPGANGTTATAIMRHGA
jgi:hypothetical protein